MMANYDIGYGTMVKIFTLSLRWEEILEMWPLEDSLHGRKNIFKSDAKPLYNGPQSLKWVKTRKAEAITQKELLLLLLAWLWTFEEMLERSWCWARQVVDGPRSGVSPGWDYYIRHYIRKPGPSGITVNNQPVVRRWESVSLHLCGSSEKPSTDSLKYIKLIHFIFF